MGLLDYGPMLKGKPKLMPPEGLPGRPGTDNTLDPFGDKLHAEELRTLGGSILDTSDLLPGQAKPDALKSAVGDMDFGRGSPGFQSGERAGPPGGIKSAGRMTPAENYGELPPLPEPQIAAKPPIENGMPTPAAPPAGPAGGLLASKLPSSAPLPPPKPAALGSTQVAGGVPAPRAPGLPGPTPSWRSDPPLPPPRPPGMGMEATGGATAAAPRIGGGLLAQAPAPPSVAAPPPAPPPPAPPPAPIAPPTPAPVPPAAVGGAAAAGGGPNIGGILGGLAGIAKGLGGGQAPQAPPVKFPQLSPSNAGPSVDAQLSAQKGPASQIFSGLLADDMPGLVDTRKKRAGGLLA